MSIPYEDSPAAGYEGPIKDEHGTYTKLQICVSGGGYYLGRMFRYNEGYVGAGSRESGYYDSREEAQEALDSKDFEWRDAPENFSLYQRHGCI